MSQTPRRRSSYFQRRRRSDLSQGKGRAESSRLSHSQSNMIRKEVEALTQPKESRDILEEQINMGLREHRRNKSRLFLSAVTAGMEVGFSILLMGVLYTLFSDTLSEAAMHLTLGFAYPIGFLFVVIGRSELFTEHTNIALLPVLDRRVGLISLGRIWGIIYAGNLIGGYMIGGMLIAIAPRMGIVTFSAMEHLGAKMVPYAWYTILGSGLLAGWMMGLLSWLVTASRETISRIFIVILVTSVIGIGGLHHSIVGSIEVFTAMLISSKINLPEYLHFQVWTTIGNIIGGAVFVALFRYGHSREP